MGDVINDKSNELALTIAYEIKQQTPLLCYQTLSATTGPPLK